MKKINVGIKKDFGKMVRNKVNPVVGLYNKDITMEIYNHFGGYNFLFTNKNGENISAIYHMGSYGAENGLFEIMLSKTPKSWRSNNVKGHLTFQEVIKWVNESL